MDAPKKDARHVCTLRCMLKCFVSPDAYHIQTSAAAKFLQDFPVSMQAFQQRVLPQQYRSEERLLILQAVKRSCNLQHTVVIWPVLPCDCCRATAGGWA